MKQLLQKVIKEINPSFSFIVKEDGEIVWLDPRPRPTEDEIQAKIAELEAKAKIEARYTGCKNYIYLYYPQDKQNSDLADKLYYENILKAAGFENLEQTITEKVEEFYGGTTLEALLSDVADSNKTAIEQLVKVGIRVAWVQKCKNELKIALEEGREPIYPDYPL